MLLLLMPVVAGVSMASVQTYLATGIRVLPILMVSSLSLFAYALNRITDRQEDSVNVSGNTRALFWNGMAQAIGAFLLVLATGTWLAAERRLGGVYFLLLLLAVLYSCPLLPGYRPGRGFGLVRFKSIPFLKNIVISATWCLGVFFVPVSDAQVPLSGLSAAFFLLASGYALIVLVNSMFCDMRDLEGDRKAGVATLTGVLGAAGSYRAIAAASGAWCLLLASSYLGSHLIDGPHLAFMILAALGYPAAIYFLREKFVAPDFLVNVAVELGDVFYALGVLALALLLM